VYLFLLLLLVFQKSKERTKCNVATQTEDLDEADSESTPAWSVERTSEVEERHSVAEQVKQAAQNAMQQTGFVYEETSGMYYDYNTGYYYNAVSVMCSLRLLSLVGSCCVRFSGFPGIRSVLWNTK
jgi:hypothetical protein